MKKHRFLAAALMASMVLFTGRVFAEGDTLDIEKAAIKTIQHSPAVKSKDNALKLTDYRYSGSLDVRNARSPRSAIYAPVNAQYQISLSDGQRQITENTTRFTAYEQYIAVLKAKYSLEIQQKLVDNLKSDNDNAKAKLESGSISKEEARMIESDFEKQNITLQKYQRNMDSAVINLNKLMGEPILKKYDKYIDDTVAPSDTIRPLQDYINDGLSNRYEVWSAQGALELVKIDQQLQDPMQHLPLDYFYDSSKYDLDQAQNNVDIAKNKVELDITGGYRELESALKDWENQKILYEYAKSDYDAASQKYQSGSINKKQLIDSQIALAQSEIQLKSLGLDLWLYQVKMDLACGMGPGITQK